MRSRAVNTGLSLMFLFLGLGNFGPQALASLTPQDDAALTSCLEDLSRGWVQPSVDQANTILSRPGYSAADWEAWFDGYFIETGHPFTDDLQNYLMYPVFWWFDDGLHLKLQTALIGPVWNKAIGIVAANRNNLGQIFYTQPDVRQSVFNAHVFFARMAVSGIINDAARNQIWENYRIFIQNYPELFSNAVTIDVMAQPLVALLRAQVWTTFVDTLPLTADRKNKISQILTWAAGTDKKKALWDRYGILVMDNNRLDDAQLDTMNALLAAIPSGLSKLQFITVREFLHSPYGGLPIVLKGQTGGAVNDYFWLGDNRVMNSFDGAPGSWTGPASSQPIKFDAWNHVAATYDGATMRVYLNGAESNALAAAGTPVTISSEPLRIGHMPDFNQWMRGMLDEIKIFGRTLTPDEIARDFALQSVSADNLLCRWTFDDIIGTQVPDSSGLGHHGQNTGAVSVPGRIGNGLYFDGRDDQIIVDDRPDLRLGPAMTLEAWIFVANEWPWLSPARITDMVNNFGCKVDQATENSFPDDIAPRIVSIFCAGNMHEYNHVVDASTVWPDPALQARETALIARAGDEPMQYLRSMIVTGEGKSLFPIAPQEFFASLSNEYFTDSWHTLDLALSRFDRGYGEPINQFLFFADVYAQAGLVTKVYTMDAVGHITVSDSLLGRDSLGRIDRLARGNTLYRFTLDDGGFVTAWSSEPAEICPRADLDGDCHVGLTDLAILAEEWLRGPRPLSDF
jgi:hypothetical protein